MGVCDVPVISSVCDAVGEGATSLVAIPFDWLAQAMGGAAGWLFEAVWSVFDTTTMVDVTKPGYLAVYNLLFGIAVFVMLIFFCLQLITGLVRRDPTALTRAALGLAKSVLGSFVVITLTALMLEVVDQLRLGIVQATGETTESMGDKIAPPRCGPGRARDHRDRDRVGPSWSERHCCWWRSCSRHWRSAAPRGTPPGDGSGSGPCSSSL